MSKTIKQVADGFGVSKTAIRKYMDTDFREKYTETAENNVILISDEGEKLLRTLLKTPQTIGNKFAETPQTDFLSVLQQQISVLTEQLAEKDKQIAQLTAELAKEREHSRQREKETAILADQAQRLQLAQMQQPQLSQNTEKLSLWQRLKKKRG